MPILRSLRFVGHSLEDLRSYPAEGRRAMGYALHFAQAGTKHPSAKPLKGFGGAGVLEIIEGHDGNAYRAVYTVRFEEAVYVLHAFQKKSKSGIKTPKKENDLIRRRLGLAEVEHRAFKRLPPRS